MKAKIAPLTKLSEADIQRTCTEFLELDGWRALRTDPCSDRRRAKGFGEIGMADHLYIRYAIMQAFHPWAEVLWVEYKRPKGKATPEQIAWHNAERARGALTWIAGIDFEPTIEGFEAYYRASGLMRRDIR